MCKSETLAPSKVCVYSNSFINELILCTSVVRLNLKPLLVLCFKNHRKIKNCLKALLLLIIDFSTAQEVLYSYFYFSKITNCCIYSIHCLSDVRQQVGRPAPKCEMTAAIFESGESHGKATKHLVETTSQKLLNAVRDLDAN